MSLYRLLLLAYPRSYRRDRGDEIIDTLLELGPIGLRQATNLLLHGLRARLGRPASRSVVAWAAITSVVCGLFLASVTTFLAWGTAQPLPQRPEAAAMFSALLPGEDVETNLQVSPATFVFYEEPLGWKHFDSLISGDGGEMTFGSASVSVYQGAAAPVVERLRANGWQVSEPTARYHNTLILAQRGSDIIEVETGPDMDYLTVTLLRDTPSAVLPAGLAGFMLGTLLAWLTFGWASRRTEHRHPLLRAPATFLFGLTLFFWCVPMYAAPLLLNHHLEEKHIRWHPVWEFLGQPGFSMFLLAGSATALTALALAALPGAKGARAKARVFPLT